MARTWLIRWPTRMPAADSPGTMTSSRFMRRTSCYGFRSPEHDSMAVQREDPELPHPPRFASDVLDHGRALRRDEVMELVDVVHLEIREIRMIAQLARIDDVLALSDHDERFITNDEGPAGRIDVEHSESEDIAIELNGAPQVAHCDDESAPSNHCTAVLAGRVICADTAFQSSPD